MESIFNSDTFVQFVVAVGAFTLAVLLMLIKIPNSEYSSKLANSKLAIVVSYIICLIVMVYTIACYGSEDIKDYSMFSMLTIFMVVHFSTSIISYSMICLLRTRKSRSDRLFVPGILSSAISAILLIQTYTSGSLISFIVVCIMSLLVFLIQTVTYIVHFDRVYKQAVRELEEYYDEDERDKIKWVRFCYIIAMLVNCFFLVYLVLYSVLPFKMVIANAYTTWYFLYMLYLTSNFISFLGSHKLVLDAFAHSVLSGKDLFPPKGPKRLKKKDASLQEVKYLEKDYAKLAASLDKWVEAKRFREYDKTREEIAQELNTSKELLHFYFTNVLCIDFKTWRTNLRIDEAKRLLLENKEASTNLIAELSGFSDRSNFHRQFVKIVGCSPREWRESGGKS